MPKPDFHVKGEKRFHSNRVLVSVALILLIALTFSPFFLFVLETSEKNRIRAVATSLANEVIEELRTMPFDEIGLEEGSPGGSTGYGRGEDCRWAQIQGKDDYQLAGVR